ncbi:MAG: preprotein translocase subunit SecA [Methylococcales bacterium]
MFKRRFRPGVALGRYPQKTDNAYTPLESWVASKINQLKHVLKQSSYHQNYIVSKVNAHENTLRHLSEQDLTQQIDNLREQLQLQGLENPIIAKAFAIIREVAQRTLGKRHYDCQLFGGWIMINGMVAQMATGEGKTLAATLPAITAALAGIPVHVITANDYLAERDALSLKPLYTRMGLSVGTVVDGMATDLRRMQYACDIVHTTNKQCAFDYLRDRLVMADDAGQMRLQFQQIQAEQQGGRNLLLRGLCFAIIDEADSVLIDEAATPLIISKTISNEEDEAAYVDAIYVASSLLFNRDFTPDFNQRSITLTPEGKIRLEQLAKSLPTAWQGKRRREALISQALTAQHLFKVDQHYILRDSRVYLLDQATGRVMPDRAWEQGLQQMIEAKEGCLISGQREPLARISYQRFFSRYCYLAGTSGTVTEVASELNKVYGLQVIKVPTHKPLLRKQLPERLYKQAPQKWQALVARIKELHAQGRPILIGTVSVAESKEVSAQLTAHQLEHRVLNAQQDKFEAEIIAQAGQLGSITVATNMAGRGTDIELGAGVKELGGLHVIATTRNDARRIDRQLYGRCARQGDPGSCEAFMSLQDPRMLHASPPWLLKIFAGLGNQQMQIPALPATALLTWQQKRLENRQRGLRRQLMQQDKQQAKILAFSGRFE